MLVGWVPVLLFGLEKVCGGGRVINPRVLKQLRIYVSLDCNILINLLHYFFQFNKAQPFKCICTFCLYNGWDPSENAKIGKK